VALSESLNQEECGYGIRSCCICPGEVATPILDKRPVPVSAEDKARMLQAEDLADTILFIARLRRLLADGCFLHRAGFFCAPGCRFFREFLTLYAKLGGRAEVIPRAPPLIGLTSLRRVLNSAKWRCRSSESL
jgi:hypothetical protein